MVFGFILTNEIAGAVIGYNPFNNRIISVRINSRPHNISIIQFYVPTSASTEEEIEKFYSQLQEVIDKIPSRDVALIMGDANAKVGKADIPSVTYGQYRLRVKNVRGSVLIDFCMTNDLVISNTCFNHHPRRLYTWNSPDGTTRNQIDYIMIKRKWKSCIKNVKTYPGADCNSDHQLLVAKCKIRLKKMQRQTLPPRFDTNLTNHKYTVEVDTSFQDLLRYEDQRSSNDFLQAAKDIIMDTASKTVTKKKRSRFSWISSETLKEIEKRRKIKSSGLNNPESRTAYKEQNAVVQRMMVKTNSTQLTINVKN